MSLSKKLGGLFGGGNQPEEKTEPKTSAAKPAKPKPAAASEQQEKTPSAGAMQNVNIYAKQLSKDEIQSGAHRAFVGGMWDEIGQLQFEFLKSQGLQPHHKLLDVGCGALRGGIHFVRYLDAGNYHGLDINASLIEAAKHELETAGLTDKQARLLVNNKFELSQFGVKFDYMLAVSVFTHLFANHIIRCLAEACEALAPDGKFFATFFQSPSNAHLAPITHPGGITSQYDHDPFHYSAGEVEAMAQIAGLQVKIVGDWNHPRNQRMLMFFR